MLEFLSTLIVGAMISMGIGALAYFVIKGMTIEGHASQAFFAAWKEQLGFTRVEFIERAVDELTTGTISEKDSPTTLSEFSPTAGCLALFIFIPWHLIVTPVGFLILRARKARLRDRICHLAPEQQALLAPEYRRWVG